MVAQAPCHGPLDRNWDRNDVVSTDFSENFSTSSLTKITAKYIFSHIFTLISCDLFPETSDQAVLLILFTIRNH